MAAPNKSTDFDRAYRAPITVWGDIRIPAEVKELVLLPGGKTALELGCGVGRFSRYLAQQGIRTTGVDFSSVAIAKAQQRVAQDNIRAEFLVGDVTSLDMLTGPFDVSFDVGCFHCLDSLAQRAYVSEVSRLLKPGAIHLLWALDKAPSDLEFSPESVSAVFGPAFCLNKAMKSRRRLVQSHWYWLKRN